ncbi:hypothetical protein CMUST_13000 [Corynebacterium mustelae]|uniref:Uncharacterized protein n=1 Tax=Corynebacterium mustelae TaxID=571915 RepID=A0A0G3H0G7_9CORY|nr:hypothetical protein [Corynebacterium mustelae]AKK06896.1 hypothetical protein CMUST_13000 [Corynebacterium mustelae]
MTTATVSKKVFATAAELDWGQKTPIANLRALRPVVRSQTRKMPAIDFFSSLPGIKEQVDNLRESETIGQPMLTVITGEASAPQRVFETAPDACVHFA